ncbi:MAG TPA: hypothetical protein VKN99_25005, partial [Polyangia bacterium]|nr:hypothetical protein [Polyangia bacterium]
MAAPPALVMVVSHTHWDREWYLPFEQFRLQLSDLVAALCDLLERTPAFAHFMLDGQTVCIEDVLALRPQLEPRLRALAGAGRLGIGPWYVLQDEFLVGGESIVRNLAEGLRVARQLGRPMAVGYLPDAFGHVAQMPRVLRGFGIDTAVLWRGVGARAPGAEWRWRGLGGAEVLGLWLPDGYGNAARLPEASTEALDKLRADLARLLPLSRAHALLWMNGVDHTWPQAHVPALLAALRQAAPEVEIAHVGLEEAVGRVRERVRMESLPVLEGELREPTEEAPVLAGVLSVRSWQKRRHDR